MELRDYQRRGVDIGVETAARGESVLLVSPTGSGKSLILAGLLRELPEAVLTVPTIEIASGVYAKATGRTPPAEENALYAACQRERIWTVKTLLNRIAEGAIPPPKILLHDEGHHATDDTHEAIWAYCGMPSRIGVTATAYRGSARETAKLRDVWGEPCVLLTLAEASSRGYICIPEFHTWPLLDDDIIDVSGGEFSIRESTAACENVLDALVERVAGEGIFFSGRWGTPTLFAVPSVATAHALTTALDSAGMPAISVTGADSRSHRDEAFAALVAVDAAVVQVNVVSEGVDLPVRTLIDFAPCMSPRAWMQRIGRAMRPGGNPRVYVTNHNLTRHAYLFEGLIPPRAVADAQKQWSGRAPTRRDMSRVLFVETLGRFAPVAIPTASGVWVSLYVLQSPDGLEQQAVLLHPCHAKPDVFTRSISLTGKTYVNSWGHEVKEKTYTKWARANGVQDVSGWTSVPAGSITQPMKDWWLRDAEKRGLDPTWEPNAKAFTILPILTHARSRLH